MTQEIVLSVFNGQVVTTSNDIGVRFGKSHKNVLQDVDRLIGGIKSHGSISSREMFVEEMYTNSRNRTYRRFKINRDGFALLAMGFTGDKALKFKLDYINAFNAMEKALTGHKSEAYRALERAELILELERGDASKAGAALRRWQEVAPDLELEVMLAFQNVQLALPFGPH